MPNSKTGTRIRHRRALAGVLLALIVFATIFVVGAGYYAFYGQASLSSGNAAVAKEAGSQEANAESLTLWAGAAGSGCSACVLGISASNSGGVPVTITAVFVTTTSGNALSSSTDSSSLGSEFLVGEPDLNVTLPLSLAVGEGTGSLTGCLLTGGMGCGIGILSTSISCSSGIGSSCFASGNEYYVSVLTSRGNTFTAEYCPSSCASQTVTSTSTSTITSTSTVHTSSVSSTTEYAESSSTVISGFLPGTNSLVITMEACAGTTSPGETYGTSCASPQPPAVYSTEEVILSITVQNFASLAMSVSVNYQSVATNYASVADSSPDSCTGGTTSGQKIAAGGSATFTCTFEATQGSSGGTVTFLGYAVGTYSSGYVTSAETVSNPIEIGNSLASDSGPLVPIAFNYASEQNPTFQPATVQSVSGNSYLIYQATMLNTANASVTILQYSFLLDARVAQEHEYYIIQPVSSWKSDTISSYACALGTGNAPTGAQCSTAQTDCTVLGNGCVPTGDTVTIDLAASGISGTTWEWGVDGAQAVSGSLAPPEVVTMFVTVVYDFYTAGSWHVLAQSIPFSGTYLTT